MIALRLAEAQDAETVAGLFRRSRALLTFLPDLHTAEEDLGYVRGLIATQRVTLAERDRQLAGFMADHADWINQLYLEPELRRAGMGSALLADAKQRNHALTLWCFQENLPARAFYEKHGFAAVEMTEGAGNAEGRPDVRYRWERPSP